MSLSTFLVKIYVITMIKYIKKLMWVCRRWQKQTQMLTVPKTLKKGRTRTKAEGSNIKTQEHNGKLDTQRWNQQEKYFESKLMFVQEYLYREWKQQKCFPMQSQ